MNDDLRKYLDEKFETVAGKNELADVARSVDDLAAITKRGFDEVETRLDRIENLLIVDLTHRIERLEDNYRKLETAIRR